MDSWRSLAHHRRTRPATTTNARIPSFFLTERDRWKDSPTQVSFRLVSRLDDFLEQNPIVSNKVHWHISSVRGTESPCRANFTFPTAVVAAAKRRRVPLLSSLSFRYRSLFPRALLSRFLFRPARPVRPSVVRSLLHLSPDRALHSGTEKGDKQRAFYQTRLRSRHDVRDTRYFRLTPCLATTPFSTPQANAGDTHGRFVHGTATRSARRAHTTPERVL